MPTPAPGPLELPKGLEIQIQHHLGTILGGARIAQDLEQGLDADVAGAPRFSLKVLALEHFPTRKLDRLASHTRIVAAPNQEQPVRGATRLAEGASLCDGPLAIELWNECRMETAGRSKLLREYEGVLPHDLTCVLALEVDELVDDPDNYLGEWPRRGEVRKRLAMAIERPGAEAQEQAIRVALGLSDLAPGNGQRASTGGGRPGAAFLQHEWILPDVAPALDAGPLVLIVHSPFEGGEADAYMLWFEIMSLGQATPEDSAGHLAANQAAVTESKAAAARQIVTSPEESLRQAVSAAYADLDANASAEQLRGPLLYLARVATSPLTGDLALGADEGCLKEWLSKLPAEPIGQSSTVEDIAWQVECAAWQSLASRAQRGELPMELEAMLLRHAGEAARYPSGLAQGAPRAPSQAAWQTQLIAENRLFLEDSNLSARVRAFDWLQRRGLAPTGFDPLATRQERRDALKAATSNHDQ